MAVTDKLEFRTIDRVTQDVTTTILPLTGLERTRILREELVLQFKGKGPME
jgi:hypothetical protein